MLGRRKRDFIPSDDENEPMDPNDEEKSEQSSDEAIPRKKTKETKSKHKKARVQSHYTSVDSDLEELNTSIETSNDEEEGNAYPSAYKETGQIIKIDVENFMCHRKFCKCLSISSVNHH